jgi:hypothetical protein
LLAGLAAQSLTVGVPVTVAAVAVSAIVFVMLLLAASITVSLVSNDWIRPARMVGGGVRRWSGFILMFVGGWFLILSILPSPIIF